MIRNETTATLRICGAVLGFSLLAAVATPARAVPAFFGAARVVPLVYAVNQGGFTATAYRESARGNVPPALAIAGKRTQIFEPNGLAVSPTGKVAISQSDGTADPQKILEYAPGASGNAAPIANDQVCGFRRSSGASRVRRARQPLRGVCAASTSRKRRDRDLRAERAVGVRQGQARHLRDANRR